MRPGSVCPPVAKTIAGASPPVQGRPGEHRIRFAKSPGTSPAASTAWDLPVPDGAAQQPPGFPRIGARLGHTDGRLPRTRFR
ncbi:hypothetical protein HUT06_17690 [Actinomadura sp. NAK00032]|uniref:hypothetical protein n=1 Tax=Actinomadura sp. NAK00032 TaxID=2742128 RepID=UPI00159095AB|nr:hypothetical protein [Actinomadura sp. NAK00032]QKW35646.1 hypothetical protein HUT06_17690 [Actinomadura sp. NAK00032]